MQYLSYGWNLIFRMDFCYSRNIFWNDSLRFCPSWPQMCKIPRWIWLWLAIKNISRVREIKSPRKIIRLPCPFNEVCGSIWITVCMCACMRVCVCERERENMRIWLASLRTKKGEVAALLTWLLPWSFCLSNSFIH